MSYVLYSTLGCHLCEQAEALFRPIAEHYDISWTFVEIAESPTLVDAYGLRIPVVQCLETKAEIGWPFDMEALDAWLTAQVGGSGSRGGL